MPGSVAPSSFTDDSEGSRVSYRARYCDLLEREVGELRNQVVFLKDVINGGGVEPSPSHHVQSPQRRRPASAGSSPHRPSNLGPQDTPPDHDMDWMQPSQPRPQQVVNDFSDEDDEICNTTSTTMVVDELTGKIQLLNADGQAVVQSDKVSNAEKLELVHERIVMLFEERRVRQIMLAWGEVVVERESQENLDHLLVSRYSNRIKKKVVFKWYHCYLEELRTRHKMEQVQRKLNRMKLRISLGKWVTFADQARKKRLMIEHMLRRLHYYSTRGVFHVWWGKCRRRQRHEYLTQKFIARWRGNTLSNNFFMWREAVKRSNRGRAIIKRFEDRRIRCIAREAVQLWSQSAHRGSCERTQQAALERFPAHSGDPFFSSWEGSYAGWSGLEVEPDTMEVTKIILPSRSLRAIPPEIGKLQYVNALYLDGNQLKELPGEVGELSRLHTLRVQQNHLQSIPAEIGRLTELQSLWASSNSLQVLPESMSSLINLTTLQLHNNSLTALPAAVGNMKALQHLLLNGNQLETLPHEIGQLSDLTTLVLSSNKLEVIPVQLWGMSSLARLNLAGNLLKQLSTPETGMPPLVELNLDDNQLEALPAGIGLLTALETLHLTNNKLSELPMEITQLVSLDLLHVAGNRLTALPSGMAALTSLQSLYAFGNKLSQLPEDMFSIPLLKKLSLSTNEIEVLPDTVSCMSSIRILCLNENKLTELPAEALGKLSTLEVIKLADNKLTTVPASMGQLSALQELSLDGNKIESLPEEVERLAAACEISLNDTPAPKALVARLLAPHSEKAPLMPVVRRRQRRGKASQSPRPEAGMQTWGPESGHHMWSRALEDLNHEDPGGGGASLPADEPSPAARRELRANMSFSPGDYEPAAVVPQEAGKGSTSPEKGSSRFSTGPSSRFSRTKSLKHMDIFTRSASPRDRMVTAEATVTSAQSRSGFSTPDYCAASNGNSTWSPTSAGDFRKAASAALAAARLSQLGSTGGRSVGGVSAAGFGGDASSSVVRGIIDGISGGPLNDSQSTATSTAVNFFGVQKPLNLLPSSSSSSGVNFFGTSEPLSFAPSPHGIPADAGSGAPSSASPVNFFGAAQPPTQPSGAAQPTSAVNFFGTAAPLNFGGAPLPGTNGESSRPVSASDVKFGLDQQHGASGFFFPTGPSMPDPVPSGGFNFGLPAQPAGATPPAGIMFGVGPPQPQTSYGSDGCQSQTHSAYGNRA